MRGFLLIAAGAALAGAVGIAARPADAVRLASTGTRPAEAQQQAARARDRAAALDGQARAASQASERATMAAAALAARVQMGEAAVAEAQTRLSEITGERRELDSRLAGERAPVARLMAGLQTLVRRPPLLALVQPGSLEDTVHLRAVVSAISPQIRARTATLRSAVEHANRLQAEAYRIAARQQALQTELLRHRADLAALSAAERLKAQRAAGSADREAERAFTIGERARTLSALARRLEAEKNPASRGESRRLPANGDADRQEFRLPVTGRRIASGAAHDRKLAFATPAHALVVAPAAGRVVFAGPYRGYGAIVIVEHPGGLTSLLTGLAHSEVLVGQEVIAGSPLGRAAEGDSIVTLELRRNGRPVDPRTLLGE